MTKAPDEPKRGRGRPRMAPDEKKRRNMTFRVRDELRDAVEELARANGRSLSEQVEYYVESSVISEIGLTYQYSMDALSPTLFKFSATKTKELESGRMLPVKFPDGHREMLTFAGKNCLNAPQDRSIVPWVQQPGGHQHAIEMAQSLIDGIVRGALEGFEATLGPEVVADLQANFRIGESKISLKLKRAYQDLEMRCKAAESEIESLRFHSDSKIQHLQSQIDSYRKMLAGPGTLDGDFERLQSEPPPQGAAPGDAASRGAERAEPVTGREDPSFQAIASEYERLLGKPVPDGARLRTMSPAALARQRVKFGDLAELPPGRDAMDDYFVQLRRDQTDDFSTAALRRVIGRIGEDVLQLVPKFAPGWPRQFEELPADTRATLIGHLRHDAASAYEALMSPKTPRDQALSAFRRMRGALLPRESADEDADEGPDEDFSDVEGRAAQGRR